MSLSASAVLIDSSPLNSEHAAVHVLPVQDIMFSIREDRVFRTEGPSGRNVTACTCLLMHLRAHARFHESSPAIERNADQW